MVNAGENNNLVGLITRLLYYLGNYEYTTARTLHSTVYLVSCHEARLVYYHVE